MGLGVHSNEVRLSDDEWYVFRPTSVALQPREKRAIASGASLATRAEYVTRRVNGLDPNSYLRDMLRLLPHWPKERLLDLAPTCWPTTRSTLSQAQLEAEMGPLTCKK